MEGGSARTFTKGGGGGGGGCGRSRLGARLAPGGNTACVSNVSKEVEEHSVRSEFDLE